MREALQRKSLSTSPAKTALKGFTLVELLVSMSITAAILILLLQLFNQVLSAWSLENKRESSRRESRSGLRLLLEDLQHLYPIPDAPQLANPLTKPAIQRFILRPPEADAPPQNSSSFAFLRTITPHGRSNRAESTDITLILYASAFSQDADGKTSYKLWRRQFTAAETFTRLQQHLIHGADLISEADWTAMSDPATIQADPVVYDLLRCIVTPLVVQENSASETFPRRTSSLTEAVQPWPAQYIPSHVEIQLHVTNRATASQLLTSYDWASLVPSDLKQDSSQPVHPEVHSHTLRIRLPAHQPISVTPP